MNEHDVINATRRWIASLVIGLNLCPFARRVFEGEKIRYVVTQVRNDKKLLHVLGEELRTLAATPISEVETTLLIHPEALRDFLDYNDFLAAADRLIGELDLRGVIQIASFHPEYQFADTTADAPENYTNRSPFPMLHLLREESFADIAGDPEELLAIPERNIETLRTLGQAKILERLAALKDPPEKP